LLTIWQIACEMLWISHDLNTLETVVILKFFTGSKSTVKRFEYDFYWKICENVGLWGIEAMYGKSIWEDWVNYPAINISQRELGAVASSGFASKKSNCVAVIWLMLLHRTVFYRFELIYFKFHRAVLRFLKKRLSNWMHTPQNRLLTSVISCLHTKSGKQCRAPQWLGFSFW